MADMAIHAAPLLSALLSNSPTNPCGAPNLERPQALPPGQSDHRAPPFRHNLQSIKHGICSEGVDMHPKNTNDNSSYIKQHGLMVAEDSMSNRYARVSASLFWPVLTLCLHAALLLFLGRVSAPSPAQAAPPVAIEISLMDAPTPTASAAPIAEVVAPAVPQPVSPPKPQVVRQPAPEPVADETPTPEETPAETSTVAPSSSEAPPAAEPQVVAAVSGGANANAAESSGPTGFSSPLFNAAYLNNPRPPYPPMSTRLREEGKVILRVRVLSNGQAEQVEIKQSSGSPRLDESARATVLRHWRFVPARQGDEAVAAWVLVPISFRLEHL
jgi:protein TonB